MQRSSCPFAGVVAALTLLCTLAPGAVYPSPAQAQVESSSVLASSTPDAPHSSRVMFIENAGQWDAGARYQVWGGSTATMWLAEDAIWLTVVKLLADDGPSHLDPASAGPQPIDTPRKAVVVRLSFLNANPHPILEPFDRLDTVVSYFIGSGPDQWRPDVSAWGGLRYVGLYPGLDLELTSEAGQLVPRLVVQPGADLSVVRLLIEGANAVALDGDALRLSTAAGETTWPLLRVEDAVYATSMQPDGGVGFEVVAPFAIGGSPSATGREPSPEDNPADLLYGTFLGGSGGEGGGAIVLDGADHAYVTGWTGSSDFPTTPGALDPSLSYTDAFVVKVNPAGSGLVYATFLGGSGVEAGRGIGVDGAGYAYLTGLTNSTDFPTTSGAFDRTYNGDEYDVYAAKLSPAGTSLAYSTYVGGSDYDGTGAIGIDSSGRAYVTGYTQSSNFPTTSGAFDTGFNGYQDAFVFRLNSNGSALSYGTFLGGTNWDQGYGIAVDTAGNAYASGHTASSEFPTTVGAFDRTFNGGYDVYAVKLNSSGSSLVYGTFLGGSGSDECWASMAVDGSGQAYLTGNTSSTDFPTTSGAFDRTFNGGSDVFVVKLNAAGSGLAYATYLGGYTYDHGSSLAIDAAGHAYVAGGTSSSDFPTTLSAFDRSYSGGSYDAFAAKLYPAGSGLTYSTFLGGGSQDDGGAIALDGAGRAHVTGSAASADFPTTTGAYDTTHNGGDDAFVVKLAMLPDIGFRNDPDGYGFSNSSPSWGDYPDPPADGDFTYEDLRQMFGDGPTCKPLIGSRCITNPVAWLWLQVANYSMNDGHCDGMASTSLRFFKGLDSPGSFQPGATVPHDLSLANARRHIAYYHVEQAANPVRQYKDTVRRTGPTAVLSQLTLAMSDGASDPNTLFVRQAGKGGHAVTPYAIEAHADGVYWIKVYDNNWPSHTDLHVVIDTASNTWSYTSPGLGTWSGDGTTQTLGIVPISLYGQQPDCPWSVFSGESTDTADGQVWLQGGGHLLITDSFGRRLGYVADQFVEEIPSAYGATIDGGLGIDIEPVYVLPLADAYTMLLDGQTLTQTVTTAITQFGPGYAAGVGEVVMGPSSHHLLRVAADGTELTFQPSSTTDTTLLLALEGSDESHQLRISDAGVDASDPVALSADPVGGVLAYSHALAGAGQYDLDITWGSSKGSQRFVHSDLLIDASDTHYFDYGAWDGVGSLVLEIDHGSDGTIDEIVPLENQMHRLYVPFTSRND